MGKRDTGVGACVGRDGCREGEMSDRTIRISAKDAERKREIGKRVRNKRRRGERKSDVIY